MASQQSRGTVFVAKSLELFELTDVESELLTEVGRTIDEIDLLQKVLEADGVTVLGSTGQVRVHPAVSEIRSHRLTLARLLGQLDLPDAEGASLPSARQVRGRAAARTRWGTNG